MTQQSPEHALSNGQQVACARPIAQDALLNLVICKMAPCLLIETRGRGKHPWQLMVLTFELFQYSNSWLEFLLLKISSHTVRKEFRMKTVPEQLLFVLSIRSFFFFFLLLFQFSNNNWLNFFWSNFITYMKKEKKEKKKEWKPYMESYFLCWVYVQTNSHRNWRGWGGGGGGRQGGGEGGGALLREVFHYRHRARGGIVKSSDRVIQWSHFMWTSQSGGQEFNY